jgi:hypothetical protein
MAGAFTYETRVGRSMACPHAITLSAAPDRPFAKRDESGAGRDESGRIRDESAGPWDESATRGRCGVASDRARARPAFTKRLIGRWRKVYNTVRQHSSFGYRPPAPESRGPLAGPPW